MDDSSKERSVSDDCINDDGQQPVAVDKHCSHGADEVDIENELGVSFSEALHVKEYHSNTFGDPSFNKDHDQECYSEDENVDEGLRNNVASDPATSGKHLSKSATFPMTDLIPPVSIDGENGTSSSDVPGSEHFSRSVSLPSPRKLVSALKGSREKEGTSPRMLSVSWAPDVYDPPPTSLCHTPKKKTQQQYKNNKKYGKGKQKGKNGRGGGSAPKDKKHYRKMGGRSDRCLDSCSNTGSVISSSYKSTTDLLDFDVEEADSPDANCGRSFLRKAHGGMRIAYAEAT